MSESVTLDEVQAHLKELIHRLAPGDEIIITENHLTVAKLVSEVQMIAKRPPPGLGKGSVLYMATDFDAPLDEMKEYME